MDDFPTDALSFQQRFATDEQCEQALERLRWPDGFICPNCGHDDGYRLNGRRLIQCTVCRYQASTTAGTIFHKTHLPLVCWFWIIYQVAQDKGGASATRLASQLNRPYKTMWHVLQKIRHAMGSRDNGISLAGLIEVDEALLGPEARRPAGPLAPTVGIGKRKHSRKKPWGRKPLPGKARKTISEVLILVEAEFFHVGNLAMKVLEGTNYDTIGEFVERKVEPDQWFKADGRQSHWVLRQYSKHIDIRTSKGLEACEFLPIVHRVISLLKHFLMGTYFGVSAKYLPGYLKEFAFRFMRRHKEPDLPASLLKACLFCLPMTYAELKL